MLSADDQRRYQRQLSLRDIGEAGQLRLQASSVLVVGAGGLGSPVSIYLAAAGVGRIGLVDFDVVDESNLQRQVVHTTRNLGRSKVESAAEMLAALNPQLQIDKHGTALGRQNAVEILTHYDIVVDASDNHATRYLINDTAVRLHKPNVYGSVFQFEGQVSVFVPGGACYRCVYPEPPPAGSLPSCAEGGVLGVVPGLIGMMQATECLKLILGIGATLAGRLVLYDALAASFRELALTKNPNCAVCGKQPRPPIDADVPNAIAPSALNDKRKRGDRFVLLDVREPDEHRARHIPGAKLIPLGELAGRIQELDASEEIIVHCRSGARSARACELLRARGFANVRNLQGGIAAWSD